MVAIHYADRGAAARSGPVSRSLTQATFAALNAPSVLDTQPWRWRITEHRIGLHADWARQLADLDPDGRLLLISCGAALHHARVALAADGVGVDVVRFPDPGDPSLLSELRYTGPADPAPGIGSLHRAIAVRRSDQRPFADRPVPDGELTLLRNAAEQTGAAARTVHRDATYVVITAPVAAAASDWLTAGEALSAVLLTATAAGLATSPVTDLTAFTPREAEGGFPAAAVRVGVADRFGPPRQAGPPAGPTASAPGNQESP